MSVEKFMAVHMMSIKEKSCCFTGHRNLRTDKIERIIINLDREIETFIAQGVTDFISGGAVGFDLIAASLIVAKKEMGRDIRLVFALPCQDQDMTWTQKLRSLYQNLLGEAVEVVYVSERYDPFCMKQRNQYMVEHSAYCICALLNEKSGTGQTVRLACKKGLMIVNVAE